MYQFKKKSPSKVSAIIERQPLAEHSFGKPSSQSLSGNSSLDSEKKEAMAAA